MIEVCQRMIQVNSHDEGELGGSNPATKKHLELLKFILRLFKTYRIKGPVKQYDSID
jgi:hypothetical protein